MATNHSLLDAPFTAWVGTLSTAPSPASFRLCTKCRHWHASALACPCPTAGPCPLVEYGAELDNGTVYMHDASLTTVTDFIAEFGTVTPIHLVHRHVDGGTHGRWVKAGA